jgi:plastocyanin
MGCGNDEEEGRTVTLQGGSELRVAAHEYSFDPETVIYESGGARAEITISLDNRGSLAHNLKVFDGDEDLGGTPTFQAGREESGTLELGPGAYRMVCTVGNHEELGMTGTLELR